MPNRRSAFLATVLALGALTVSASVNAQTPDDPAPPESAVPVVAEQGNEIVHSWSLAPAGNDADGGGGNRPDLSYVADPGSVIEDAVTLYNLSNVPLTFEVYGTDAFNDDNGDFALLGTGEAPTQVGTWVGIGGRQVPVPARTQVTIPITITIPENARPGDHVGAILAANAATSTDNDGREVILDRRTGPRLYVRVNGPLVTELAIAGIETDHDGSLNPLSGATMVTYTIENRGNIRLSGTARATVGGPFGIGERSGLDTEIADLLPGESITVEEQFDGIPTMGVVITNVELEPSGADAATFTSTSRSTTTFAPPIGVLLALLAGLFAWLAVRAFRRHRDREVLVPEVITQKDIELVREHEHQQT
jgi:hypothetical protein